MSTFTSTTPMCGGCGFVLTWCSDRPPWKTSCLCSRCSVAAATGISVTIATNTKHKGHHANHSALDNYKHLQYINTSGLIKYTFLFLILLLLFFSTVCNLFIFSRTNFRSTIVYFKTVMIQTTYSRELASSLI